MGIVQNGNVLEAGKHAVVDGKIFTGASAGGRVVYSQKNPNIGKVWRSYNTGISGYWTRAAYGNGIYVAVSTANMAPSNCCIMSSPDGVTWVPRFWTKTRYQTVIFAHDAFFTSNYDQATVIYKSVDGITWDPITVPQTTMKLRSSFCNGLLFLLTGLGSPIVGKSIIVSPDGVTWSEATHPYKNISSIAYGNGLYVGVSGDNGSIATITSANGYSWSAGNCPTYGLKWVSIAYGNGIFVATNATNGKLIRSSDGVNWVYYDGPTTSQGDIVFSSGMFIIADKVLPAGVRVSTDGVNWVKHTFPAGSGVMYEIQAIGDDKIIGINTYNSSTKNFVITP